MGITGIALRSFLGTAAPHAQRVDANVDTLPSELGIQFAAFDTEAAMHGLAAGLRGKTIRASTAARNLLARHLRRVPAGGIAFVCCDVPRVPCVPRDDVQRQRGRRTTDEPAAPDHGATPYSDKEADALDFDTCDPDIDVARVNRSRTASSLFSESVRVRFGALVCRVAREYGRNHCGLRVVTCAPDGTWASTDADIARELAEAPPTTYRESDVTAPQFARWLVARAFLPPDARLWFGSNCDTDTLLSTMLAFPQPTRVGVWWCPDESKGHVVDVSRLREAVEKHHDRSFGNARYTTFAFLMLAFMRCDYVTKEDGDDGVVRTQVRQRLMTGDYPVCVGLDNDGTVRVHARGLVDFLRLPKIRRVAAADTCSGNMARILYRAAWALQHYAGVEPDSGVAGWHYDRPVPVVGQWWYLDARVTARPPERLMWHFSKTRAEHEEKSAVYMHVSAETGVAGVFCNPYDTRIPIVAGDILDGMVPGELMLWHLPAIEPGFATRYYLTAARNGAGRMSFAFDRTSIMTAAGSVTVHANGHVVVDDQPPPRRV